MSSLTLAYPLNTTPLPDEPSFPNVVKVVYRADMTSPDEFSRAGYIAPRGMDGSRPNQLPPDTSLYNHAIGNSPGTSANNSGYVSATETLGLARWWVNNRLNHNGWVYYIASSGNFIRVNDALLQHSPHPAENEYAALGLVWFNQILGWRRSTSEIGPFIPNPAYNPSLYNSPTHPARGPNVVELAGFPRESSIWSESPWANFATCELRMACYPTKSSHSAATDYTAEYLKEQNLKKRREISIWLSQHRYGFGLG